MQGGWRFRLAPTFFGPTDNLKESFLEQAFILQYHMNMQYSDIRAMPIRYRFWFVDRLAREVEQKAEALKKQQDGKQGLRDIPMGEMNDMMRQIESSTQDSPRQPRSFDTITPKKFSNR